MRAKNYKEWISHRKEEQLCLSCKNSSEENKLYCTGCLNKMKMAQRNLREKRKMQKEEPEKYQMIYENYMQPT